MSYPKQSYVPMPVAITPQAAVAATPIDEALINAIRMSNDDLCKEILLKDKEILLRKGWNNLTPLHQACLSGQINIVLLFIENGADPNSLNSFEETPLHYACRRGVVSVVHYMIKNGADPYLVDKKGRNCMHFAALNGSVSMLHYLQSFTDLNLETPDITGKNILHISVEMWHYPALCYLAKHNRVDPSLQDLTGVTPLHIAVEKGFADFIWTLLRAGGCELLKICNQKGDSPLNIARKTNTTAHQNLFKAISQYANCSGPPSGPIYTWLFLLTFSFFYATVVFLSSMYMHGYGGHFTFVMFSILLYISRSQTHRIAHICRWPNPAFVGLFVGGIMHCAIAQFGYLFPALWPCPFAILCTTVLAGIAIFLLIFLIFGDPGIDRKAMYCETFQRPMSMLDLAEGRVPETQFCPYTEQIHDYNTKYCKLCENPVINLDHHCLFLNNCIAGNNHKHFILLLLAVMCLQISFVYNSFRFMGLMKNDLHNLGLGDPFTPYLIYYYKANPWIIFLTILCFFSFLWEGLLVYTQLSSVMKGTTTYRELKKMNRGQTPLSRKRMLLNLFEFFIRPTNPAIPRKLVA